LIGAHFIDAKLPLVSGETQTMRSAEVSVDGCEQRGDFRDAPFSEVLVLLLNPRSQPLELPNVGQLRIMRRRRQR